jgi:hypothetical protein
MMGFSGASQLLLPSGLTVLAPSGDTTGTRDADNILAAQSKFTGGLGGVFLGPGNWYWEPGVISFIQGQAFKGICGSAATFVNAVGAGTGPMVSYSQSGTFTGGQYGAPFSGMSFIGYGSGSGTVAVAASGLQGMRVSDLYIAGFPGGGLDLTNASDTYAEQGSWKDIVLVQNGTSSGWNWLCSNSSFDYTIFEILCVALSGTDGLRMQDGAQMRGIRLEFRGNFYGGAGNTGAVIAIDRGASGGTSYIEPAMAVVSVESAGSGTGHYSIYMGSSNSESAISLMGVCRFIEESGVAFQGLYNPSFLPVAVNGYVQDTVMGGMIPGDASLIYGGQLTGDRNAHFSAPFEGNVYLQFGNPAAILLANGNNTLVWNGLGTTTAARAWDMFLEQPASGAAGTVTWPAGTIWTSGTAPVLSTASGVVDKFRFIYLPHVNQVFGSPVDPDYA